MITETVHSQSFPVYSPFWAKIALYFCVFVKSFQRIKYSSWKCTHHLPVYTIQLRSGVFCTVASVLVKGMRHLRLQILLPPSSSTVPSLPNWFTHTSCCHSQMESPLTAIDGLCNILLEIWKEASVWAAVLLCVYVWGGCVSCPIKQLYPTSQLPSVA